MEAIVERGGWCIRVGDPTMAPLPKVDGVVDYCKHELLSDWLDVFLCARCRFFLGSGSGLQMVASIFGVPVAAANIAPMSSILGLRPGDLGIAKLVRSRSEHRFLTFREVLGGPVGGFRFTRRFEDAGLDVVENSPDDVKALAMEMLDRLENRAEYTESDAYLQSRLRSLIRPGHFMYGSAALAGRDFLRKYQDLVVNDQAQQYRRAGAHLGLPNSGALNGAITQGTSS
jgi:putative glycosyltransferase (TIGR04372 family)